MESKLIEKLTDLCAGIGTMPRELYVSRYLFLREQIGIVQVRHNLLRLPGWGARD